MKGIVMAVISAALLSACASTPSPEPEPEPQTAQLVPAGFQTEGSALTPTLCKPRIVDGRAELSDDCVNVIDRSPSGGRQIHAIGRETKQLRSLCENMVLPKCRRKY
ncbi:MAG: hypothetical protein AAGE01_04055 [Pseudomonadota bacterium]